jgi:hypothetical protein
MKSLARLLAPLLGSLVFVFGAAAPALAAPPHVDRSLTLPRLVFAGDLGLGVAHLSTRPSDLTGAGLNLEAALGITDSVELGLRTGARLGAEARALQADNYGRTLWTETYGTAGETWANPEFRVRWAAYRGRVVEVGLDGRVYTPLEQGSRFGVMFGVPFAFHIGNTLRIDTGVYIPILVANANLPTSTILSVPGYFWFQVSHKVWLGPMVGLRHVDPGGPFATRDDFLLGFGVGWQVASAVDLKWMVLIPRVNTNADEPRAFGGGFGVQFRIGE